MFGFTIIQINFKSPEIFREEIQDEDKILVKKKRFVRSKEAENLGLKHFLGHTRNLPYTDCGLAISKSSYNLNKLQDVILIFIRIDQVCK